MYVELKKKNNVIIFVSFLYKRFGIYYLKSNEKAKSIEQIGQDRQTVILSIAKSKN